MTEIAYQNKDITSKILGENLKHKSFAVYGINVPRICQVLPTNLPAIEANELRLDNLFLLEDGSLALVDYESDYDQADKVKYLNYITRTVKRCFEEGSTRAEEVPKIRMIVIYTADIKPEKTQAIFDVGCLQLQTEEAFLSIIDSEKTEIQLEEKIKNGKPLTEEEQMKFIILPLTHQGKEEKQKCIQRCFALAREVEDVKVQTFILSGMLVFSDKVVTREDSKRIREWIMLTKVGQLFEEEKLEYAKKAVEEAVLEVRKEAEEATEKEKRNTAAKLLKKGFSTAEILEVIEGMTAEEVEKLRGAKKD